MSKTGKGPRKSEKHKEAGNEHAKLQHKSTLVSKMGEKTRGVGGARMRDYSELQGFNGQQINQQSQSESWKDTYWICKDKADVMAGYRLAPGLKLNWSHF